MTKYQIIEEYLLKKIKNKEFLSGEKIPSENKLAEQFNVSRMTARKAIDNLMTKNYIYKIKAKGAYVRDNENKHIVYLDEMIGFNERVSRSGKTPKTTVDRLSLKKPDEKIRKILNLDPMDRVFYIERLRWIDDDPVILEITYMPEKYFNDLTLKEIKNSKYEYIHEKNYVISHMIKEYFAILPNEKIKKLLHIKNNSAMFKTELISKTKDDKRLEYTKIYYNQSKYRFIQNISK